MNLIVRIGDAKHNVKELAQDCIDKLAEEGNTGPALVGSLLYRQKGLPKVCDDPKHLVTKVNVGWKTRISISFGTEVWFWTKRRSPRKYCGVRNSKFR